MATARAWASGFHHDWKAVRKGNGAIIFGCGAIATVIYWANIRSLFRFKMFNTDTGSRVKLQSRAGMDEILSHLRQCFQPE